MQMFSDQQLVELTCRLMLFGAHQSDGCARAMEYVRRWFEEARDEGARLSIEAIDLPSGRVIAVDAGRAPFEILIAVHADHVPPKATRQLSPRVEGDRLIGRGAVDMDGGFAAAMKVILHRALVAPDGVGVRLLVMPDEEGTMATMREYAASHPLGRFVITPEPTKEQLAVAAKGRVRCRIVFQGIAAHDSRAYKQGVNAIRQFVSTVAKIDALPLLNAPTQWFPEGATAEPLVITTGITQAGEVPADPSLTALPDHCEGVWSFRYDATVTAEQIVQSLRSLPEVSEVTPLAELRAVEVPLHNPFVRHLAAIVEPRLGSSIYRGQRGASVLCQIPTMPGIEWGPIGGDHHGPNEWLSISSLQWYAGALNAFLDSIS